MTRTSTTLATVLLGCTVLAACSSPDGSSGTSTTTAPGTTPPASSSAVSPTSDATSGGARPSPTIEGRLFGDEAHCLGPANCYLANQSQLDEAGVAAMLARLSGAKAAPPGNGPWPFVVLDAPGDGREVRSAPRADAPLAPGEGKALQHRVVYAFCRVADGPAADGKGGVGGWLRIQSLMDAAEGDYYMDASHLHPFHHNGAIKACA